MTSENDYKNQLLKIIRDAVARDNELREQYKIGEKFRFIKDRLQAVLHKVEEHIRLTEQTEKESIVAAEQHEETVYVYLFNAHGQQFQTWEKMLNPAVFYEYSINRPIYKDKNLVEAFIRSKTSKLQHGYLSIAITSDVIKPVETKDALGNTLIKIKEGSLKINRLISFTHNGVDYLVSEEGKILRKK